MAKMKAARWHNRNDVRVEELEIPQPKANQIKIEVKYCGICGSDLHEYLGGPIFIPVDKPHPYTGEKAPLVMGHEFSGEVVEVGPEITKFKVGDRVFVKSINQFANILKINTSKESASVQAGILKLEVPFEEIKIVEEKKEKVYNVSTHKKTPVRSEIDLRGKMVDEGIYELETYLDRATLNGYTEVYVIHGKGTGALREGILKYLKTSKYVKEYRIGGHGEGGLGCTVVTLK